MVELAKRIGYQPLPITLDEGMRMADWMKAQPWRGKAAEQEAVKDRHADSPPAVPFLELRSLSVNYGNTRALKEINLTVREGEMAAVIGRNGAGKTSLLRAIMGLVQPVNGSVLLCGEEISAKPVWERSRQIGYLPQDPNALLFADRVFDELEITLRNYGLSKPRAELMQLLEQLGIARYAGEYPRDLSVGERQRVALAAILVMQPRLLLLDEPTRGLDYFSKKQLVEMLSTLNHKGLTLMVVTHDVEFMAQFAQRVIWLEDGEVIADGDPREILLRNSSFQPQMLQLFGEKRCLTVGDVVGALETQESSAVVLS
jgi:energy-coupling factor transport system ATP-binding protein